MRGATAERYLPAVSESERGRTNPIMERLAVAPSTVSGFGGSSPSWAI